MKKGMIILFLSAAAAVASPVNLTAVRAAAAYSSSAGGTSFLALQNGQTLLEQSAGEPHKIYSGTKAFWGLAALAAAEDGLLSLDERVGETIASWNSDPRKARVTIRQLLDFSCGLEPVFSLHNNDPGDRDSIAIRAPLVANPGTAFIYGPSALQVFHAVLKEKLQWRITDSLPGAACPASPRSWIATLFDRQRGEPTPRGGLAPQRPAMGQARRSRAQRRRPDRQSRFAVSVLARVGGEPRLLDWVVEQSPGAGRTRVRYRVDVDSEVAAPELGRHGPCRNAPSDAGRVHRFRDIRGSTLSLR